VLYTVYSIRLFLTQNHVADPPEPVGVVGTIVPSFPWSFHALSRDLFIGSDLKEGISMLSIKVDHIGGVYGVQKHKSIVCKEKDPLRMVGPLGMAEMCGIPQIVYFSEGRARASCS
jgi:hypothetical protein